MLRLSRQGVSVPYPVGFADDVFDLEHVRNWDAAAAQLSSARLLRDELDDAFGQLIVGLRAITAAGIAHGDLSAYDLLWWEGRLWFIDFLQSIDIATNMQGLDFLHRDVLNICGWFQQRGPHVDAEEILADLVSLL